MNLEENFITIEKGKESFFFDTYAFIEILHGSEKYDPYKSARIFITKLNLFELYLAILRLYGEEIANTIFDKYYPFVNEFDESVIKEAAKLKVRLNKRDVSMTDCIGYCFAAQLGIKFLTGDSAFEGMENVEFVK